MKLSNTVKDAILGLTTSAFVRTDSGESKVKFDSCKITIDHGKALIEFSCQGTNVFYMDVEPYHPGQTINVTGIEGQVAISIG